MQFAKLIFYVLIAVAIAGCAHPIVISPDISKIERDSSGQVIQKNVGYYILDDREKEVTTSGGGGDKVRYKPYKDIETGFYKMLSNVFSSVSVLKSEKDAAISKNKINYIISLDVSTNSSSSSMFTWPPTTFGVNLNCDIKDVTGKNITSILAVGEGHAEFDEFKSDFSLAGKRASQDALMKMQRSLLNVPELTVGFSKIETPNNQSSQENKSHPVQINAVYETQGVTSNKPNSMASGTTTPMNNSTSQKLRELQVLRRDEIITEDEFQNKKKQLLEKL